MSILHTIKVQRMELRFDNEAQADQLHMAVADLCRTTVAGIVEGCLQSYSIPGAVVAIREIDIDLGTISYHELATELPRRLYQCLDRELARIVLSPDARRVVIAAPGTVASEALFHFLQFGYLPWNCRRDIHDLVYESLRSTPNDFGKTLRTLGQSSVVRQRLIQRFSNRAIIEVIRALEPGHTDLIIGFHDHLVEINTDLSLVRSPKKALEKTLWFFILNNLIVDQGSTFNALSFAKSVLHQFACHFNLAYDELIQLLRAGIRQWERRLPAPYYRLIDDLVRVEPVVSEPSGIVDEHRKLFMQLMETDLQSHQTGVEAGLRPSKEKIFSKVLHRYKEAFVLFLKEHAKNVHSVSRLLNGLSGEHRRKLVSALAPQGSRAVLNYRQHLLTIQEHHAFVPVSARDLDDSLWTFLIVCLLDSHGSRFNQGIFIRRYFETIGAHYNVPVKDLAIRVRTLIMSLPVCSRGLLVFLEVVSEIFLKDLTIGEQPRNSSSDHPKDPNGTGGWQRAAQLLLTGSMPLKRNEENAFLKAIQASSNERRYIRGELFSSPYSEKIAALSSSGFERLLLALLPSGESALLIKWLRILRRCYPAVRLAFGTQRKFTNRLQMTLIQLLDRKKRTAPVKEPDAIVAWLNLFIDSNPVMSTEAFISSLPERAEEDVHGILTGMKGHLAQSAYSANSHKVAPDAGSLVHWLLTTGSRYPVPAALGFESYTEALEFAFLYYPHQIGEQLGVSDRLVSWRFFQKLNAAELDHIARAGKQFTKSWYSALLHEWCSRLNGFYKQNDVMADLKRVFLWSFYLDAGPSDKRFLQKASHVLNRYALPSSFNVSERPWSLPVRGDIQQALQIIERELSGKVYGPSKRRSKRSGITPGNVRQAATHTRDRIQESSKSVGGEAIYVANAGLVLLHPYFNYLFGQLGFLENGKFASDEAQMKAIRALHFVVTATEGALEEDCVLNKVLCGCPVDTPLSDTALSETEKEWVEGMLGAFKSHWTVVDTNSNDEIRGNWLVREGKLVETEKHWELFVQRKPYDLLMSTLPFTISPICFSWMNKLMVIHWL